MKRIIRFLRLPELDRSLLIKSWVWLAAIRVGLYLFPFETLRTWIVSRTPTASTESLDEPSAYVNRVTWAVHAASRYLPGAQTCLVQALATQRLLVRRGVSTRLLIGLTRASAGVFEGHAWVESDGQIVMGKAGHERFVPLKALGERIEERSH